MTKISYSISLRLVGLFVDAVMRKCHQPTVSTTLPYCFHLRLVFPFKYELQNLVMSGKSLFIKSSATVRGWKAMAKNAKENLIV